MSEDVSFKWRTAQGTSPDGGVTITIRKADPPFFSCTIPRDGFTEEAFQQAKAKAQYICDTLNKAETK